MISSKKSILIALVVISIFSFFTNVVLAESLPNPLGISDPRVLVGRVINAVLGIVGSIALLMFIYGGLLWVMSGGNDQKIAQGKAIMLWTSLGLVVIFFSYAMVTFVIGALTGNKSTSTTSGTSGSTGQQNTIDTRANPQDTR